jgi:hypothetical protein
MARCPGCGADVTFVSVDGIVMPLETWATTMGPRFRIDDFDAAPWTASRLDPTTAYEGHSDHRESCPARQ